MQSINAGELTMTLIRSIMKVLKKHVMPQENLFAVADYILSRIGPMSAMKLQKLVYYSQVWSLVWTERELFPEEIQAWANGPVVWELYCKHRGQYRLEPGFFSANLDRLSAEQREVIDRVLGFYGSKDPQWLSNLTHMEAPWRQARVGIPDGERGSRTISKESILEYYPNL
jgi:uncharacterized phage-associated protein